MQKSFILTLCKTPLRNIIQDQALLRILYFFYFFFFCLQCEYIGWKNNTHCIGHIFARICLTETKVNNLCLTKISARRSLVPFISLTLVPKNRNGKKMFYHALHKICDNTGKYGSVKTSIHIYFMQS